MSEGPRDCPVFASWTDELTPIDGLAAATEPEQIERRLRARVPPSDQVFDQYLPRDLRILSPMFWTPLRVAVRAAEWIDEFGIRSVVDVGSGVGKFCVATALASRARFVGVEHRERLVVVARELASVFGCEDRVLFAVGQLPSATVPAADAYYAYNPFEENVFRAHERIDSSVELSLARYGRDRAAMQDLLNRAPLGTYLLTYNGFGAPVPGCYRPVRVAHDLRNELCLYRKTSLLDEGALRA
ncbi:MAG TPA: hypothetical protein VHE30_01935 [Polyangiaceae bacterium]|nr:hypothetical protein [Polyangiaceae bacterium]